MIDDLDDVILKVNHKLKELEKEYIQQFDKPEGPVFFIVGAPRSGTTLLLQTIINHFHIGYINNFIAKFWEAPVIGSILFKSLGEFKPELAYHSEGGFTGEIYGPHEFGYFWRGYFNYGETHALSESDHRKIDVLSLTREIAGLESIQGKPLVFKNPAALSLQIDFLAKYIPNSYFIYIRRDPFYIAQSLYLKRLEKFKDPGAWYSVKPAMYTHLIHKSPAGQIAGQVFYTIKKMEYDLSSLSPDRFFTLDYEKFCRHPDLTLGECQDLMKYKRKDTMRKLATLTFEVNNQVQIDPEKEQELRSNLSELDSSI